MVSLRAAERHPEEFEADRAAHQFRERTSEKKQEIHRRRSATLMTCLSLVLMLVIMIIGVTMLNNYEKMQNMEQVLYQISGKIDQTKDIEEAAKMQEADLQAPAETDNGETAEAVDAVEEAAPLISQEELAQNAEQTKEEQEVEEQKTEEVVGETKEETAGEPEMAGAEEPDVQEVISEVPVEQTVYVIQKGDTLAKICMKYYGNLSNMEQICEMNGIANKDNILYGQKIILP